MRKRVVASLVASRSARRRRRFRRRRGGGVLILPPALAVYEPAFWAFGLGAAPCADDALLFEGGDDAAR